MKLSLFRKSLLASAVLLVFAATAFAAEKTTTIKVYGMTCPKCANGVAGSLKSLKGVKAADVSVEKSQAIVVYEDIEVTLDQLTKRIEEGGFSTTPKKAESAAPRQKDVSAKTSADSQPVWCPAKPKGQLCGHGTADRLAPAGETRKKWEAAVRKYNQTVEEGQKALLAEAERLLKPEQVAEVKAWLAPPKTSASAAWNTSAKFPE